MASIRTKFHLPILLFLLLLLGASQIHAQAATPPKPRPPATILIIRHAEKLTDGRIDLSPTGFERARLLPTLFSPTAARPDLPTPQVLFATHLSPHSNRPVQTVTPLAAALHLPIDDSISNDDYPALASALLSGKYAAKVVLVVWHHGKIPQLASALGATHHILPGRTPSSTASGELTMRTAKQRFRTCPMRSCRATQSK